MISDFDKIVAIRFGSKVLFGQAAIDMLDHEVYDQIISKAEFELLARMDLGEKWTQAAKMPVIIRPKEGETIPMELRNPRPYRKSE